MARATIEPLRIGISLGDVTGIGPEVTLKALRQELAGDNTCYVLIGDARYAGMMARQLGLELPLADRCAVPRGRIVLHNPVTEPLPRDLRPGAAEAAGAAVEWVREGARECLAGKLDALVTAPVNKQAIVRAGIPFVGQTELLSQMAGTERTAMMLLGQDER